MMMRLALAAALLPAAAAPHGTPTCTEASCCSNIVYGKCTGNTHLAPVGEAAPVATTTAAQIAPFICAAEGTEPGSYADKATANTIDLPTGDDAAKIAACCDPVTACTASACGDGFALKASAAALTAGQAPTQDRCCDAVATCSDKDGAGSLTAAVAAADCGAGWQVDGTAGAAKCAGLACDLTLESDKVACCTICPAFEFSADGADCADTTPATCPAGKEYSGGVGNTATGSEATLCTDCAAGKVKTAAGTGACADHATCTSLQYISTTGTASVDVACTDHSTTDCAAGTQPKTTTTETADATTEALRCEACPTGKFSATSDGNACADHATCAITQYISTVGTASVNVVCTDNTVTTCAAGNQPKTTGAETVIAGDAAAACEACPTGKWTAGVAAEMCADHSTCPAVDYISTAGTTSADVVCSDCPAGKTSPAANSLAACTDITGYCEGNVDGDDDGTDLDKYACPATKYVADNVQTAITTLAVAEGCTATAATGTAIGQPPLGPGPTDAVTSCALSGATCATPAITAGGAGAPTGCDGAAGFTGSEASCTALTDSADTTCVWATGTCAVFEGGGTCAYTAKVEQVGDVVDTTCPGPAHAEAKTAGAAAAAPLAAVAALVAALA